jgi:hypothetical protein
VVILVGETTVLLAVSTAIHAHLVVTVMIVLVGLIVMLLVEHLVAIVMTDPVHLIVTLVHLVVSIATLVLLVVTVMIVLAGLIVMLLVEHLAVIVMTDHVHLIVILVSRVMIALVGLIVIHVHHALQRKSAQMKLKAVLANVAQVAKCLCHPSVLAKIG